MSQTIELPRLGGPGSGLGGAWKVIVKNDDHNTFDGVARALSQHIPQISLDKGYELADLIHRTGVAVVWTGHLELAEHYWAMLQGAGLTMAPLEQD